MRVIGQRIQESVYHEPNFLLQSDPQSSSWWSRKTGNPSILRGVQGERMTLFIVILTLLFALGGISPLLVTDSLQDEMLVGQ